MRGKPELADSKKSRWKTQSTHRVAMKIPQLGQYTNTLRSDLPLQDLDAMLSRHTVYASDMIRSITERIAFISLSLDRHVVVRVVLSLSGRCTAWARSVRHEVDLLVTIFRTSPTLLAEATRGKRRGRADHDIQSFLGSCQRCTTFFAFEMESTLFFVHRPSEGYIYLTIVLPFICCLFPQLSAPVQRMTLQAFDQPVGAGASAATPKYEFYSLPFREHEHA